MALTFAKFITRTTKTTHDNRLLLSSLAEAEYLKQEK